MRQGGLEGFARRWWERQGRLDRPLRVSDAERRVPESAVESQKISIEGVQHWYRREQRGRDVHGVLGLQKAVLPDQSPRVLSHRAIQIA